VLRNTESLHDPPRDGTTRSLYVDPICPAAYSGVNADPTDAVSSVNASTDLDSATAG
jgi:hypothetical protein